MNLKKKLDKTLSNIGGFLLIDTAMYRQLHYDILNKVTPDLVPLWLDVDLFQVYGTIDNCVERYEFEPQA